MRTHRGVVVAKARKVAQDDCRALAQRLGHEAGIVRALGAPGRRRVFSPYTTFCLFLWQVLSPDRSCRSAVLWLLAALAQSGEPEISPNTAAYCKARMRLAPAAIGRAHEALLGRLQEAAHQSQAWCGRVVKVVDGSGLSMLDTPENQQRYPQSKSVKPGCGFPELRLVALFSLASGALLDYALGNRHTHERTLFERLWDRLEPGDVVLADRGFCGYANFYRLAQQGVDCVMRLHQRRSKGVRLLKRLGPDDELVQWTKNTPCPKGLSPEQWDRLPTLLTLRHVTFTPAIPGFRTKKVVVATTLIDPLHYPAHAIAELYRRRWLCELYLRDIKITLGMDILRCKTPDMAEKQLAMHVIAYNLIRLTMLDAARQANLCPGQLSFKATVQAICHWVPRLQALPSHAHPHMYDRMLRAIARTPLPDRPNRAEPRARKRRPKNYQLLTEHRQHFKETPHRNRYTKQESLS